jgi:hypothetical protein
VVQVSDPPLAYKAASLIKKENLTAYICNSQGWLYFSHFVGFR